MILCPIGPLFWCLRLRFCIPPNLPRALAKGAVSSSSFFLSSSSHNLLLLPHALLDFDQTWSEWPVGEWLQKLSTVWPQRSCRGHRGQKGNFTENATPRTHYIALARDSCILTILTSSTKVITLQISLGSFGVTGVEKQGQITNNFKCQK